MVREFLVAASKRSLLRTRSETAKVFFDSRKLRIGISLFVLCAFGIVLCYVKILSLGKINYSQTLAQVTSHYLAIQQYTNYAHDLLFVGILSVTIPLTLSLIEKRKRGFSLAVIACSVFYFNIMFLWTAKAFSGPLWTAIFQFFLYVGQFCLYLGLPTNNNFPIDFFCLLVLILVFSVTLYASGWIKAFQITLLTQLPLPIYIYIFDKGEWNLFVISQFGYNPVLSHFTNAVILYVDLSLLAFVTFVRFANQRYNFRMLTVQADRENEM